MGHRNAPVEARQGAAKGRGRVALNENQTRLFLNDHVVQRGHHARRRLSQRLPGRHHIQIVVRFNSKSRQHLVEQPPVLCRNAHARLDTFTCLAKMQNDGS